MKKRILAILVAAIMLVVMIAPMTSGTALADGPYVRQEFHEQLIMFGYWVNINSSTNYPTGHQESGGTFSDNQWTYLNLQDSYTITATPKDGYAFDGWSNFNAPSGAFSASGNTLTVNYKGNSQNYTATANFHFVGFSVNFSAGSHGSLTGTNSYAGLPYGPFPTAPTINPSTGYSSAGWSPNLPSSVSSNGTYTAQYSQNNYTVKFVAGSGGSLSGKATYNNMHYGDSFPTAPTPNPNPGYSFAGWSPSLPQTVAAGDSTYTAQFTQDIYSVTFAAGDHGTLTGTTSYSSLHYNDSFPAAPAINPSTGYTGNGWSPTLPNKVTGSGTYTAQYSAIPYTITFAAGSGGTLSGTTSYSNKHYGDSFPTAPTPNPNLGYTFASWTPALPTTVAGTQTYTANFSFTGFTVTLNLGSGGTFNSNGLSSITLTGVPAGTLSIPAYTLSSGYSFSGWSGSTNITANTTLSANYEYYVTFAGNSLLTITGTNPVLTSGHNVTAPSYTVASGYRFNGWDKSLTGLTGPAAVTANTCVKTYNVTISTQGNGHFDHASNVAGARDSGSSVNLNDAGPDPDSVFYMFLGWKDNSSGQFLSNTTITVMGDCSYTAVFTDREHLDLASGDHGHIGNDLTGHYASGTKINLNDAQPTPQTGYTVDCWKEFGFGWSGSGTEVPLVGGQPIITIGDSNYFKVFFKVANYTITYDLNNGTVSGNPSTYTYFDDAFTLNNPTRPGYTFTGWTGTGLSGLTMTVIIPKHSTGNRTYTANWNANRHDINYYVDGALFKTVKDVAYGTTLSPITAPTQTGYTFSGWSGLPGTMPDSNVTVTGTFGVNHHDIIYMVDGTEYDRAKDVAYGTSLSPIAEPTQEGYTFSGWSGLPGTMPDSDVTVTGTFGVNHHDIIYMVDGTEYDRVKDVAFGTSLSPIAAPTMEGYTFSGWSGLPGTMPDSDVTVTGAFAVNHHDIIYMVDGTEYDRVKDVAYGTVLSPIAEPTEEGYTFSGWSGLPGTMPDSDVTVTGTFGVNHHDIIYMVDGTEYDRVKDVAFGEVLSPIAEPTQEGYTFSGWSGLPGTMPDSDVTVTGTFGVNHHDIIYMVDGTEYDRAKDVAFGEALSPIAEPSQEGYTFSGWSGLPGTMPDSDVTVTGTFSVNHHDIIYMVDGTEYDRVKDVAYGTSLSPIAEPTQEGYTFSGWSGLPGTMPDSDVTVTGAFAVNHHDIIYMVDGTEYDRVKDVAFGTSISPIAAPTKEGYTFSGWSIMPQTMPDSDVTVTGTFAVNHHDIIYMVDGTEYDRVKAVAFGTSISPIAQPTKVGYTFSGWSTMPQTMPDSDVTVTGTFAINHHDIIYMVDGTEYDRVKAVAYGTGISPIAAPTKEGYTFGGWSTMPTAMPDSDLTVTGAFAIDTYKVRFFRANGTTQIGTTQTVNWGTAATLETAPAVTGYTFAAWALTGDNASVTSSLSDVKENIDAVATYNIRTYTVTFLNYDGTTVIKKDKVNYGDDATPPADPAREGYTFTGWSPSYDNVTGNIEAVAQFTINTYNVKFVDYDGTVIATVTVNWNAGATAPAKPAREGYTFTGWDKTFTNVVSDLTVTAQYTQTTVANTPASPTATVTAESVPQTGGGANAGWMWWLLLLIPAGLLFWFFIVMRRRKDEEDKNNNIG